MPLWLIFTLASVLVMAGAEIAQKIALTSPDDISSETNNFVVWLLQALLSFIIFLVFTRQPLAFPLAYLPKLLLLGVIYFWGGTLYYGSFKGASAGLSSILVTISVVLSTSLGIIFFHESTSLLKLLALLLVLSSIFIVKYSRKFHLDRYNWLAIGGGLLYGIAFTIDKSFAITVDPMLYLPLFCLVTGLMGLVFRPRKIIHELPRVSPNTFRVMAFSSLFGAGFNTFTLQAYAHGAEVGRVDAINNFAVILVIILEVILLKNRQNLLQKLIAASIGIAGLFLLSRV